MHTPGIPNRGDQTREALLAAAITIFGRDGFHAASTRAIAREAGANQALIGYHFGGKQGLYLAAFESIAAQVAQHMLPVIAELQRSIAALEPNSPQRVAASIAGMETLFGASLDLFGRAASSPWVRLIMREQLDPDQGMDILNRGIFGNLLDVLTQLVAVANGGETTEQTRLQALMLLGQMLVFLTSRGSLEQQLGWTELGAAQLAAIKNQLAVHLQACFKMESVS